MQPEEAEMLYQSIPVEVAHTSPCPRCDRTTQVACEECDGSGVVHFTVWEQDDVGICEKCEAKDVPVCATVVTGCLLCKTCYHVEHTIDCRLCSVQQ